MPHSSFTPWVRHKPLVKEKRDKAGTLYRRNRMYDPGTGRFTQEDPIGLAGRINLYGYAGADPVNLSDPFGLCPPQKPICHWIEATSMFLGSVGGFIGGGGGGALLAVLTGGVAVPAVPAGAWAGAGAGAAGGLAAGKVITSAMFSDDAGGGSGGGSSQEPRVDLPGEGDGWTKLRGGQGWRDAQGNTWKKDRLHKDHWDVSDRRGNKVREVDFEGRQIWPGGPKNKNK